jgi:hypothetical protein
VTAGDSHVNYGVSVEYERTDTCCSVFFVSSYRCGDGENRGGNLRHAYFTQSVCLSEQFLKCTARNDNIDKKIV